MSDWRRLKYLADVVVSNVDKLTSENEIHVRLVNYTDVYHGDQLTPDLPLMEATASAAEIAKFRLSSGDILITKDSETADDIGVAAYIESASDDMICGYHLSRIRAERTVAYSRYLYWALSGANAKYQMSMAATGITRFGLRVESIRDLLIRVPSDSDQRAVADHLDIETTRIDALISKKHRLIELSNERKRLLCEKVLADFRQSEQLVPLKYLVYESDVRQGLGADPTMLSVSIHHGVVPRGSVSDIESRAYDLSNYKICRPGDIVINRMRAFQGGVGLVNHEGIVSPDYTVLRVGDQISANYLHFVMRSPWFISEMTRRLRGIGSKDQGQVRTPRINFADLGLIKVPVPPIESQNELALSLIHQEACLASIVDLLTEQLDALAERRQASITGSVTGEVNIPEIAI